MGLSKRKYIEDMPPGAEILNQTEESGMGRPVKKERTLQQTTDLHRAIEDACELIYGACFKLIRAQDIIVDEKDTLHRLQVSVQVLRNYAEQELTQIK